MHIQKFPRDILNILLISQLVQYIWSMLMGNSYFHIRTNHKAWMCIYTFHAYSFRYKISSQLLVNYFHKDEHLIGYLLARSSIPNLVTLNPCRVSCFNHQWLHNHIWRKFLSSQLVKGNNQSFQEINTAAPPLLFVHISPIVTASNTTHTPTHIITHRQTISWKEKIDKRFKKMQMR